LLAARELELLSTLLRRGHASMEPVSVSEAAQTPWREGRLPPVLLRARISPEWSSISQPWAMRSAQTERTTALHALQEQLLTLLS
jgi:hypothetical protein